MKSRAFLIFLLPVFLGCSAKQRNEDFVPAENVAQRSLESYLQAWQAGETNTIVRGTSPTVSIADTLRDGGRTLETFTVMGPTPCDQLRCFAVRLTLGNPREEIRERYVVVGLDPIWIFRHDDYEKATHWCDTNQMASDSKRP